MWHEIVRVPRIIRLQGKTRWCSFHCHTYSASTGGSVHVEFASNQLAKAHLGGGYEEGAAYVIFVGTIDLKPTTIELVCSHKIVFGNCVITLPPDKSKAGSNLQVDGYGDSQEPVHIPLEHGGLR